MVRANLEVTKYGCRASGVLAVVFSLFLVDGFCLNAMGHIPYEMPLLYVSILLIAAVLFIALLLLDGIEIRLPIEGKNQPVTRKELMVSAIILVAAYGVVFLAAYPGYFCYDTNFIISYMQGGEVISSQPFLFILIEAFWISFGQQVFGSLQGGVALCTVVQGIVAVALALLLVMYLHKCGAPRPMRITAVIYLAVNPMVSMFVNCTVKDLFFSEALLAYSLYFIVTLQQHGNHLSVRQYDVLAVLGFLVMAFRSNGLVALGLFNVLVYAIYSISHKSLRRGLSLLVPFVISALALALWTGPLYRAFGIVEVDSRQDMISVPAEQLARICAAGDNADDGSYEEAGIDPAALGNTYRELGGKNSDLVRPQFIDSIRDGNFDGIIKLWLAETCKNLGIANDAFLVLTEEVWHPFDITSGYNNNPNAPFLYNDTETSAFACWTEPPVQGQTKLAAVQALLWRISRFNSLKSGLPVGWFVSIAPYAWLLILTFIRCMQHGNRRGACFCMALLCVLVTNLLGPIALPRYYLYLYMSVPVLVWELIVCHGARCPGGQPPNGAHSARHMRLTPTVRA